MSVLTFFSFLVAAFLMETRVAFLKPKDIFPKQNLNISQSWPQKLAKKQHRTSSNTAKNETENILFASTEYFWTYQHTVESL